MQDKIVYAGITMPSFVAASQHLSKLADLEVDAKQVERVTKGIGQERCRERDQGVAAYQALPLVERKGVPAGVTPPAVAVVSTDGGRIQVRDDSWDRHGASSAAKTDAAKTDAAKDEPAKTDAAKDEPAKTEPAKIEPAKIEPAKTEEAVAANERGRYWREDKIGLLMAMTSTEQTDDPCPDIPENFLDPTRMRKLVRGLGKGVPVAEEAAREARDPEAEAEAWSRAERRWHPPEVQEKRLTATRQSWETFGPMVAAAAWAMGLFGAARRAFVADGAENNWTIWRCHFSSFVPILDFIHALSYVHAAAHAGAERTAGWKRYVVWIRWVWQGQVTRVIEALRERQAELGTPSKGDAESSPRMVVAKALTYLENNQERMHYDAYRRQGLPIVSSYVESAVKQFNQRVKGTEKFWGEAGAEAILQLRADHLSADEPLEAFWERRQAETTGQRPYRRAA